MNKQLLISDLNGLLTIEYKGGDTPLRVGEPVAVETPFSKLMSQDFDLKMGIKVSQAKYDKAARKQNNMPEFEFKTVKVLTATQNLLTQEVKGDISEKFLGKKKIKNKDGKWVTPKLSLYETVLGNMIEMALANFYNISNVTITLSLYNGTVITWKKP